jgi:DNA-directed RNA polymerase specialized sigma24 family protein
VLESQDRIRFEQVMLPHLNSAANLARWMLRNRADSEDVVQEAMLRAYRFFHRFHGGDVRAWLLQIVRSMREACGITTSSATAAAMLRTWNGTT